MKLTDVLIADLDREAPITKRALEAVPGGRDDWKPHAKSMALGRLAGLVAMMPSWLTMMITQDEFDVQFFCCVQSLPCRSAMFAAGSASVSLSV